MVVIRLARGGAKKRPFFTIVAADSRSSRDGGFVERFGFYNPKATESETKFRIAQDRLAHWRSVGAQVSPTVARLVKTFGASAAGDAAKAPAVEATSDAPLGSEQQSSS
jgi:small subunit ribosomal protein S16